MKSFAVLPANRLTSQRVGVPFTAWMGWEADHHFWVALRGRQALTNIFHDGRGQTGCNGFPIGWETRREKSKRGTKGKRRRRTHSKVACHACMGWMGSVSGWMDGIHLPALLPLNFFFVDPRKEKSTVIQFRKLHPRKICGSKSINLPQKHQLFPRASPPVSSSPWILDCPLANNEKMAQKAHPLIKFVC